MNLYNGKGDRPRNIFTRQFRENFDKVSWGSTKKPTKTKSSKKIFVYGSTPKDSGQAERHA